MSVARKEAPRATTRVPARLRVRVSHRGHTVSGLCIDLSAGGLGLWLESLPLHGETVSLQLVMPDGKQIEVEAEVVHAGVVEPRRCGVRFRRLDPPSLFAIHGYVADNGATQADLQ